MSKARVSPCTPVEAYFWLDFRRRWTVRRVLAMAVVLLGVIAIQTAVSWGAMRPATMQSPLGPWIVTIASWLQLLNNWGALVNADGLLSSQPGWVIAWLVVSGVMSPFLALIMPAVLSTCIAAEREQLRLEDLKVTLLTPGDILFAKGLSCAMPFLVLAVVYALVDVATLFLLRVPAARETPIPDAFADLMQIGNTEFSRKLYIFSIFTNAMLSPVIIAIRAAVLVCASALCSRVTTALVMGFAMVLVAEPLLASVIAWGVAAVTPPERGVRDLLEVLLIVIAELTALRLIIPLAIQAIDPNNRNQPASVVPA